MMTEAEYMIGMRDDGCILSSAKRLVVWAGNEPQRRACVAVFKRYEEWGGRKGQN